MNTSTNTNKYLWYCGANKRVVGEGTGAQDAFTRLSLADRQTITVSSEFCVIVRDPRDLNAEYWHLRGLPRG